MILPPCGAVYLTLVVWGGRVIREEWGATCEARGRDPEKPQDFGMIYAGPNPRELVIVLPDLAAATFTTGATSSISPAHGGTPTRGGATRSSAPPTARSGRRCRPRRHGWRFSEG